MVKKDYKISENVLFYQNNDFQVMKTDLKIAKLDE